VNCNDQKSTYGAIPKIRTPSIHKAPLENLPTPLTLLRLIHQANDDPTREQEKRRKDPNHSESTSDYMALLLALHFWRNELCWRRLHHLRLTRELLLHPRMSHSWVPGSAWTHWIMRLLTPLVRIAGPLRVDSCTGRPRLLRTPGLLSSMHRRTRRRWRCGLIERLRIGRLRSRNVWLLGKMVR